MGKTLARAGALALAAVLAGASYPEAAVAEAPRLRRHQAIEAAEYEIEADVLKLRLIAAGLQGSDFELARVTDLHEGEPRHTSTFRFANSSCHVVATEMAPGKLHGLWHDKASGETVQFDREASGRTLLSLAEDADEFVASSSQDAKGFGTPSPLDLAQVAEKIAAFKAHAMSAATSGSYHPDNVFYGGGNCYPGDNNLHVANIGFVLDRSFENKFGGNEADMMLALEAGVAGASAVFEAQFNVRLQIGPVHRYSARPTQLSAFRSCPSPKPAGSQAQLDDVSQFLDNIEDYSRSLGSSDKRGLWFLATNCFADPGYKGYAWIGNGYAGFGCGEGVQTGRNTGFSNHHDSRFWKYLAHEVGHSMGMWHSAEQGSVTNTPGIMGYSPNYEINGDRAFSAYRAAEACKHFTDLKRLSCRYFLSEGGATQNVDIQDSAADSCVELRYGKAANHCEALGKSLCSPNQLRNNADTACGTEDSWVWTTGSCNSRREMPAFRRGTNEVKCKKKKREKAVRCC